MKKQDIKIQETEHVVDPHFFDVIGNEFKEHVKGMAEWLKNSVDAYIDKNTPSNQQFIIFRFTDEDVSSPIIECIDFVGMEASNIDNAFKRWGDPKAAKRGKNIKTYGGHGNGGKFYMRQAFSQSYFITYKNGLLNIFGFSKNKQYGYDKNNKNKKMSPEEALKFANLDSLPISELIKKDVLSGNTGFTVVRGFDPYGIKGKFKLSKEMDRLKNYPQSRRILQQANVSVVYNDQSYQGLLRPDELPPYEKFEEARLISVPETLTIGTGSEKTTVSMGNEKYHLGKLVLRTSYEPLVNGALKELNRIDIFGEIGVIASYHIQELGVKVFPYVNFIYGEFSPAHENEASILEDPENDCVSNDRTKLIVNDTTKALVEWIAQEIDKLASEIASIDREKQKANQKEITSKFNDVLNAWKNKHMKKIMSEIFSGQGGAESEGGGGSIGTQVTPPPNGFDFKYPEIEIPVETTSKITLKISVPEALPLGATIFLSINNDDLVLDFNKCNVKSDYIKTTPDGHEVAFINVSVTGEKLGSETILTATAGKLSASVKIKVVEAKEGKSGKAFPRVLLSSHDLDPLGISLDGTLHLNERETVVYQRPQDVPESIYWINTSSPMASMIYDRFKFDSMQWRNFLFERYVDIFVKEAIHELWKKDSGNFTSDAVDQKIAEVVKKVHQSANEDLEQFLFDESYVN